MSAQRKRNKGSQASLDEDEQAIEDLADAIIESLSQPEEVSAEAFDLYVQRMRAKVHSPARQFKTRLNRGYHVLMSELSRNKLS